MKKLLKKYYYRIKFHWKKTKKLSQYFLLLRRNKILFKDSKNDKTVVFLFEKKRNLSDSFAYYYSLIIGFVQNGYSVGIDMSYKDSIYLNAQNKILFITKGVFIKKIDKHSINADILIGDDLVNKESSKNRFLYFTPDLFNRKIDAERDDIIPFSIHPHKFNSTKPEIKKSNRKISIFFSGNCDKTYYDQPLLWNLLNRYEIISIVKENFKDKIKEIESNIAEVEEDFEIVIQDWTWNHHSGQNNLNSRIPNDQWFNVLNNCSFFIAPPGVNIPFSHNAIEAMAVGTIPIINYENLFTPSLENNVNCLSFRTKDELISVIKKALNLDQSEIGQMRENVLSYYANYLNPKKVVENILNLNSITTLYYHATNLTVEAYKQRKIADKNYSV